MALHSLSEQQQADEAERVDGGATSFLELAQQARALPADVRHILSEQWSLAARFEHASIASFNKFSLELLAVGAPGTLVAAANRAALQEVEHAQACFAAASATVLATGSATASGWASQSRARCCRACITESS